MCESRPGSIESSAQVVATVKNMPPRWRRRPGTLNGAVTGNPRSELREPQATEARSFVWGKGSCGSTKPVVALGALVNVNIDIDIIGFIQSTDVQ